MRRGRSSRLACHVAAAAGAGFAAAHLVESVVQSDGGLPSGWSAHTDTISGKTYYHHAPTGETTWIAPPATQPDTQGTAPLSDRAVRYDDRGLSLEGLQMLAHSSGGRSCGKMWSEKWIKETAPAGWTVEVVRHPARASGTQVGVNEWLHDVYTNLATGEQLFKTPENAHEFKAPPGACSVLDLHAERLAPHLSAPTHYLSYPWHVPLEEVVQAVEIALREHDEQSFVWMDLCANCYHDGTEYSGEGVRQAMRGLHLVQVCSAWDDPERLKRSWIMLEALIAVVDGDGISFALSPAEHQRMADALRNEGPEAILDKVFDMKFDVEHTIMSGSQQSLREVTALMQTLCDEVGGREQMDLRLAEATRKAYASAIEMEFERQWALCGGEISPAVLDLGHQLAELWALTDDQDKARRIFEKVLAEIRKQPSDWKGGAVVRRDRTAAALVKLILQQKVEGVGHDAHRVEKDAFGGELAVSFQGVAVAFLAQLVQEQDADLKYISTDAVVERVIKPASKRASVTGPSGHGRAYIETLHEEWKGRPTFFLSHAWRQTFHVSGCEWRGGAVQALIQSARCSQCKENSNTAPPAMECPSCDAERRRTFVWFDIFCVNQHLRSPYGGLQAFAFEPLRNGMVSSERVEMFLETWDDPATLSRVWCLEELRVAMLLGKEVRICMPKQAMDSFRQRAIEDSAGTVAGIEKALVRISIEHASATFERDRKLVFGNVDASVGRRALDRFAKEIMRKALLAAAFPEGLPTALAAVEEGRSSQWTAKICEEILAVAQNSETGTAQKIRIRRAAALMRLRENQESELGLQELADVAKLAMHYYGPRAEEVRDIYRQLYDARQRKGGWSHVEQMEGVSVV
jgi:hypothetical protein